MTTDATRRGSRDFSDDEYQRVVKEMQRHVGYEDRITVENLSAILGIGGRTIRAILSEADGTEFVVCPGDEGMFVAESFEDAEPGTRRIEAQARKMLNRANRRRDFGLPRFQQGLW